MPSPRHAVRPAVKAGNTVLSATEPRKIELKIFEGASLAAPFAATVAEFACPYGDAYKADQIRAVLGSLFRVAGAQPIQFANDNVDFPMLVATLGVFFQDLGWPLDLQFRISKAESGLSRVAIGYFNAAKGRQALRAAFEISDAVFAHLAGAELQTQRLEPVLRGAGRLAHGSYIGAVSFAFLRAARRLGIPVCEPAPGSNVLVYGQGANAIHHSEAICSLDSATGFRFALDKAVSNQLVTRIGFPGVTHIAVGTQEAAREAAQRLGTPLVVKPADRNGSLGVTVGIDTRAELDIAVAEALRLSQAGAALVEQFVPGDEYRLSVFAGKFFRASRLVPAHVVGDGQRSIAQLIADENAKRREVQSAHDSFVHELKLDPKMTALIAKQGFAPESCPPAGQRVRLAGTSNLKSGGRREEVTPIIHPDNAAMAEAIAGAFRLNAAGIDFITPDISKSWGQTRCAVLEVNANPGTDEEMAAHILRRRFGEGKDGRIPSVLVVGDGIDVARAVADAIGATGKRVGLTSNSATLLDGRQRCVGDVKISDRIAALLLDSGCEALVVQMTRGDLVASGLPHTRYDTAIAARDDMREDLYELIADNAVEIIDPRDGATADTIVRTLDFAR